MSHRRLLSGAIVVAGLAACSSPDGPGPSGPDLVDPGSKLEPVHRAGPDPQRDRHERIALRVAKALADPDFRASVAAEIARSPYPEKKVHLQAFLDRDGGRERSRLARLAGEPDQQIRTDLEGSAPIEAYFPVPVHRAQWRGGPDLLVATAETDRDAPVAFDLSGRRRQLDRAQPPATPVLMVGRAEVDFSRKPEALTCILDCGGTGGGSPAPQPGLYLTQTKFNGTYEGWFKGDPEFEVHVLGQAGTTAALTTIQCAGEHAGGPYAFDQNSTAWSGSVMLMSQTQLDQYKVDHPGQNLRIFVVEDDDTACEIKIDSTRTANMFKQLKDFYGDFTGGKDTTTFIGKTFKRAPMLLSLIKSIVSWFKTNDDPVGNAVDDPVAAATIFPGANWLVRGENNAVNGAIKLDMR